FANDARPRWGRGLGHIRPELRFSLRAVSAARPVQRQIEFGQPRRGERDGLPALQDRLDQLRAQEGEANETANVAPGNAVTFGQLLERPGAANRDLLKPRAPPRNRLDQRWITCRA